MDTLIEERRKAQFDAGCMKVVYAGGERLLRIYQRMASLAASDPVFQRSDRVTLTRQDLFKSGLRKAAHVRRLMLDHNLSEEEVAILRLYVDERSYADLHWNMFVPALKGQATEEQQKKWLPLAKNMEIIGAYAQTELGHGSNVQGLETTATFDVSSDEFILNSPNITSTKWWPGGLGKVATHALVHARLIINSEDHGVHAFIVQVRSLENHIPLHGIVVGDIGTKFGNGGTNTADNGFMRFDHVRIPRENLLMRMAKVTPEGNYFLSHVPSQILYGALITARQTIISEAAFCLSRAVTIAVRYSLVRRQFSSNDQQLETQILDYATQQHRLFPLLATTYAFQFAAKWMRQLYDDVLIRLKNDDFTTLREVHACTSGLKALTTSVTAAGIEECRKLCGGHGYLCSSGIPELYAAYLPACTYDGDNIVLLRQVGMFLLKTLSNLTGGKKPVGSAEYLGDIKRLTTENSQVLDGSDWLDTAVLLDAFMARSARLASDCAEKVFKMKNEVIGLHEYASELVEAARAHCQLVVLSKFIQNLQEDSPGWGVKRQLELLCFVYALSLIRENAGEFLAVNYLTRKQVFLAKRQLRSLFSQIRPNALGLVDAFNHSDHLLGSTLGCYDGDVYTRLYREVWKDPFNQSIACDGYEEFIKPILKQQWGSKL